MVFSEIHPLCRDIAIGIDIGLESLSVEFAYKILCGASAERAAGVEIAQHHPLFFATALDRQPEQIGTLPDTFLGANALTERTLQSPFLHVRRGEYEHFVFERMSQHEHPLPGVIVPEHIWIARFGFKSQHRVCRVCTECLSIVITPYKALSLTCIG